MNESTTVYAIFERCVRAMQQGRLVQRESHKDKEFHFQNWMSTRFAESGFAYEAGGRNTFPDFRIVHVAEGYEIKGLAYPGREVNYDSNSQMPAGFHNGRTIFYVFGRYPAEPDGDIYPVLDLVICHGDFLNADHEYTHQNKNLKGFGSYGDVMIRDRKMYVAPTPFGLAQGLAHTQTLVLPDTFPVVDGYKSVGNLVRREAARLLVGYNFDLWKNVLTPEMIPNPAAGREHAFRAWRLADGFDEQVTLRSAVPLSSESEADADE